MKATCMVVRSFAPSTAEASLPSRLGGHVRTCLACQAELSRYSKLRRRLAAMADIVEPAPGSVAPAVADAVSETEEPPVRDRRMPHLAGVAAAAGAIAAATAGAVAIRRQSRGII